MIINQQPNEQIVLQLNSPHEKKKDYLCWSIFNTLICNWCCGLVAIMSSVKVREYNLINPRNPKAEYHSKRAYKYNLVSTLWGIIGLISIVTIIFKILNSQKKNIY